MIITIIMIFISGFIAADIKGSGGWTQVRMILMILMMMKLMMILMMTIDFKTPILGICFMLVIQIYSRPPTPFLWRNFRAKSPVCSNFKVQNQNIADQDLKP